MSEEQNIAMAQRFTEEVFNEGKLEVVDELFAVDYVNHSAPPGLPPGVAGTKAFVSMFRAGFPDLVIKVEDIVAHEDTVVVRHITRGTQTGPFMGIPPTGKKIEVLGIDWVRIRDEMIVEGWGLVDQAALIAQLGMGAPPPH